MARLVVKPRRPLARLLALLPLGLAALALVWFALHLNHWHLIQDRLSRNKEAGRFWQAEQRLTDENTALRAEVIRLQRAGQIDAEAAISLQNDILELQDQVYRLKDELEFYEGVMAAAKGASGLNAQGLHIEAARRPRSFRFRLVLTHVAKNDKVIEVTLDMSVEGLNAAGAEVLSLREVSAGLPIKRNIRLKNFERIEGNMVFPEGFRPLRVVVRLQQKGSRKPAVSRVFEWPAKAG